MAGQPALARKLDPAEDERSFVAERVRVQADSYSELAHPSGS
jgi:hypothetical protein